MNKSYADVCLERAEKATQGPWRVVTCQSDEDVDFICDARTDVPELAKRLKRACDFLRYVDGTTKAIKFADELEAISEANEL